MTESEILDIRDEADELLLRNAQNPKVPAKLVEMLRPFGVDGGFWGYGNLGTHGINKNRGLNPQNVASSQNYQPTKKQHVFIAEARCCGINLPYESDIYLGDVLPYDYCSIANAYIASNSKKSGLGIFVAHASPALINSKPYKLFHSQKGAKDFFVLVLPMDNHFQKVVWLCLSKSNGNFSEKEVHHLQTLFDDKGLGHIIRQAIIRGSEVDFLSHPFTPSQWKYLNYLSKCDTVPDKKSIASQFHVEPTTVENHLGDILDTRELIQTKGKCGRIEAVHALVYNKPFITWFNQRVVRPKGDKLFRP